MTEKTDWSGFGNRVASRGLQSARISLFRRVARTAEPLLNDRIGLDEVSVAWVGFSNGLTLFDKCRNGGRDLLGALFPARRQWGTFEAVRFLRISRPRLFGHESI
ncbi:MAG: hypothetical protein V3W34_10230 [Phycisphaerae bacterium]